MIVFIYIKEIDFDVTLTRGVELSRNPWGTEVDENVSTLEWNLPSPPSYHTFEEIPSVKADLLIAK